MDEPRILQVTYGAFSCTLEGFEDPVETLMAVAEYFRGLATSDPGFAGLGAVPDAAEMARQVRAAGAGPVEVRVEATGGPLDEAAGDGGHLMPPEVEPVMPPEVEPVAAAEALGATPADEEEAAGSEFLEAEETAEETPLAEPVARKDREEARDGASGADRLAARLAALRRARLAQEDEPNEEDAEAGVAAPQARAQEELSGPESPPALIQARDRRPEPIPASAHDWGREDETEDDEGGAAGASGEARRLLSTSPDEDALLRILSRAESQLADPEAARRREALAHVKAAVAAAEAGRAMGDGSSPDEDAAPFREDFEAVVRTPVAEQRPAAPPLRLVASQRVDLPRMKAALSGKRPLGDKAEAPAPSAARTPGEAMPSRPAPPAPGSFADFAGSVGAAELPDLLEAAAAWIARADGDGSAGRAELLHLAREPLGREPGREDVLRVIGTLLREGRLARAGNGRFRPGPLSRLDPARLAG